MTTKNHSSFKRFSRPGPLAASLKNQRWAPLRPGVAHHVVVEISSASTDIEIASAEIIKITRNQFFFGALGHALGFMFLFHGHSSIISKVMAVGSRGSGGRGPPRRLEHLPEPPVVLPLKNPHSPRKSRFRKIWPYVYLRSCRFWKCGLWTTRWLFSILLKTHPGVNCHIQLS